jgi:hypothetical protein
MQILTQPIYHHHLRREFILFVTFLQSFNLRCTVKSKPDIDSSETPTNASVSAIIEKANAIRQVLYSYPSPYFFHRQASST